MKLDNMVFLEAFTDAGKPGKNGVANIYKWQCFCGIRETEKRKPTSTQKGDAFIFKLQT
jgi:hypothetical protein